MKEKDNCWEFWNCPKDVRDKCPAFLTFHGTDCFDFAENYSWYKQIKKGKES